VRLGWGKAEMAPYTGPAIRVMARMNLKKEQARKIIANPKEFLTSTCE